MIIITTVGEAMTYFDLEDGATIPHALLELMKWEYCRIDLDDIPVRSTIESQHIAFPEHVARRLGLIGAASERRRRGLRLLRKSGHPVSSARCRTPSLVTSLKLRGGLPTMYIDPRAAGYVDLYDDIPF